jgi:hypothetical protein
MVSVTCALSVCQPNPNQGGKIADPEAGSTAIIAVF